MRKCPPSPLQAKSMCHSIVIQILVDKDYKLRRFWWNSMKLPKKTSTTHSSKTQQTKRTGHYTPLCWLDWFFPEFIFPTFPTMTTVNICTKSSGCGWCPCWDNTLQSIDGRCNLPDLRHLPRDLCMPSVQCEIIWNHMKSNKILIKKPKTMNGGEACCCFIHTARNGETLFKYVARWSRSIHLGAEHHETPMVFTGRIEFVWKWKPLITSHSTNERSVLHEIDGLN